jgi:D-inositol-3-phosphate glycosyltransferase
MLDPADERHWYAAHAAGEDIGGVVVGELGALRRAGGPGSRPLWLDGAARAATEVYAAPAPAPSTASRLRWAAAPVVWRGGPGAWARVGLSLSRARRLLWRHEPASPSGELQSAAPAGYLDERPGPGMLPLYSAVHPITGDQLLTTDLWEAVDLGYLEPTLLGHLVAAAHVTGRLGTDRPRLRWASRLGQRIRSEAAPLARTPGGGFDPVPAGSPLPVRLTGWALSPQAPVARIDVVVDGETIGRARLGVARPEAPTYCAHPAASVSGFEFVLLGSVVPPGSERVAVAAQVHDLHGATFELAPVEVSLARGDPREAVDLSVARVRARARRLIGGHVRPARESGANLLVFTHQLDLGGAQLYLMELLARLLARPGFTATVCAPVDGPLRYALEDMAVPVHVTTELPGADPHRYESRLAELAAWAAPQGFDAALVNTVIAFHGVHVAELLSIPALMAVHESFELDQLLLEMHGPGVTHPHVRERVRQALGDAALTVFVADATRRQYLPHARDPSRFVTLPYGIELDAMRAFGESAPRAACRRRLGIDESARLVVCLGTIEPRKSQAMLAQAFAAVAADHADATLALVGGRGDVHEDALREYVNRAGLGSRVKVVPVSREPYAWLAGADLLVCCSDVESLPRVILEAMTFGVPVLATRIFGVPEIVEDGVTGFLCEPRDLDALAAALGRVLSLRDSELAEVANRAAAAVAERHDPDVCTARFADALDGVLRGTSTEGEREAVDASA